METKDKTLCVHGFVIANCIRRAVNAVLVKMGRPPRRAAPKMLRIFWVGNEADPYEPWDLWE